MMRVMRKAIWLIISLLVVGCADSTTEKALGERLAAKAVQRCRVLVPATEKSKCDVPADDPREQVKLLHAVMVQTIRSMGTAQGLCELHATFLICRERDSREVLYRLEDTNDKADSRMLYVWSRTW
jgi:hypothetical protein